jgi:hypothetical protein
MRIRMGRRKAIQAIRATKEHKTPSLKSLMELSWFGGLDRIWSIECVLEWSLLLLQWILSLETLDGLNGGGWGVFIASNHFLAIGYFCWRWAHRTSTVQCSVRATSACPLEFGAAWPLESLHRTVWCHTGHVRWPLTLMLWLLSCTVHHCSLSQSTVDA